MLSRALGTLHNLSKRGPTRHTFVACEAVAVLIPLLKAEVTLYATKTLLILAYLIDEKNNHLIMADEGRNVCVCFFFCFFPLDYHFSSALEPSIRLNPDTRDPIKSNSTGSLFLFFCLQATYVYT